MQSGPPPPPPIQERTHAALERYAWGLRPQTLGVERIVLKMLEKHVSPAFFAYAPLVMYVLSHESLREQRKTHMS